MKSSVKLVLGCGYLGERVADAWRDAGARVIVTTRSASRANLLERRGFEPVVLDVTRPDTLVNLPDVDTLLYAVGFDVHAGVGREQLYVGGLQNVLARTDRLTNRLIYISSTGVYGQANDEWVDEHSACEPQREGGRVYCTAESELLRQPLGQRSVILRLAGIYGPGRIPYLAELMAGQPLPVAASGYLNLIHVDDAVQIVLAAETCNAPNRFVVADGTPVLRRDYYAEVARCLGVAVSFVEPDPQRPQAQRATGSKRIRNAYLLSELPVELKYPSFRQGVAASLFALPRPTDG